jgi:hypothetical protein
MEDLQQLIRLKPADIQALVKEHRPDVQRGASIAIAGLKRNSKPNSPVSKIYWNFAINNYLPILIPFYIICITMLIFFFPLTITLLLLAPGVIWQLFSILPTWALSVAKKRNPFQDRFFVEGLRPLNPELAEKLDNKVSKTRKTGETQPWMVAIQKSFSEHVGFWTVSFIVSLFSLIPIIGWLVTAILQTYINCMHLSSKVLQPYMTDIESMDATQKERWLRENRPVLIGFSAPLIVLSAIPIIGAFALMYADAAAADLVHYEFLQGSKGSSTQKGRRNIDLKSPQQRDNVSNAAW